MDFIFNHDDTPSIRLVDNQLIGGLKLDIVAIAFEPCHQVGTPLGRARPTRKVAEYLVDDLINDDVEEVLAVNEVAESPSNQIEVGAGGLVGSVCGFDIVALSIRFTTIGATNLAGSRL